MATKLKVNVYHWGFKLLAFALLTAGMLQTAISVTGIRDILYYLGGESYIMSDVGSRDTWNVVNRAYNVYINVYDTDSVNKEIWQRELDAYVSKGFRYFVFNSENEVIYDDGTEPKISTRGELYTLYPSSYEYSSGDYNGNYALAFPTERYLSDVMAGLKDNIANGRVGFYRSLIGIAVLLSGIVLTAILAGRKRKCETVVIKLYDKLYNDIFLTGYAFAAIGLMCLCGLVWHLHFNENSTMALDALWTTTIASGLILSALTFWITLSFSKWVKVRRFLRHTLVWAMSAGAVRLFKKAGGFLLSPFHKIANKDLKRKIIFSAVIVETATLFDILIVFALSRSYVPGELIFLWSITTVSGLTYLCIRLVLKQIQTFEEVKKGAQEIRNGNLGYKIPECSPSDMNELARNINNIGEGLEAAVNTAIISEKMKTELITNVSHDLKTPLTSIISYVELLSEDETLSPEAKDYIAVLKHKSERLKQIISDLFDLSKGTSGNVDIHLEQLDLKRLVEQTLADLEDKITASGKTIKKSLPDQEMLIYADGKRLYRVFQNLIDNALKYSLDGTRIYLNLIETDDRALIELSNIADYEMNFSESEILERFARGDKARSSDGSGLGLSIAETFTKLCGGKFGIKLDGDMFKVTLEFDIIKKASY